MTTQDSGGNAQKKLILTLDSQKGGVGKTTLALAIALEFLQKAPSGSSTPVVYIDADIFGTEVTDALRPCIENPDLPDFSLALMDALTQSAGGVDVVRNVFQGRLKAIQEGASNRGGNPHCIPMDPDNPPLVFIPSHATRDPKKRADWDSKALSRVFVSESVGFIQVEARLTMLLDAVIETMQPELILIDNAPFHLPISRVWEKWRDIDKVSALLFDDSAKKRWAPYCIRQLNVTGPEEQDVRVLFSQLIDYQKMKRKHDQGVRWVVNKDVHIEKDDCNLEKLLPGYGAVHKSPLLGHVCTSPQLVLGAHGRNVTKFTFETGGTTYEVLQGAPVSYSELIKKVCQLNLLTVQVADQQGEFPVQDWRHFLMESGEAAS